MQEFQVKVFSYLGRKSMGKWKCSTTEEGLILTRVGREPIRIPIGSKVQFTRPESFQVGGIVIQVIRLTVYQDRLARDLAAFVSGGGPAPKDGDYDLERHFFYLALLPLGIPILMIGGLLPTALGLGLAYACFAVSQNENRPTRTRTEICVAIVAAGYLPVVAFYAGLRIVSADAPLVFDRGEAKTHTAGEDDGRENIEANDRDKDDDGLDDRWEMRHFSHLRAHRDSDQDGDGVPEWEEFARRTNPKKADSDGDFISDRTEIDSEDLDPMATELVTRLDFDELNRDEAQYFENQRSESKSVGKW